MSAGEQFIFFFIDESTFIPLSRRGLGVLGDTGDSALIISQVFLLLWPLRFTLPSRCHARSSALLINAAHQCIPSYITPESSCQAPATSLSSTALSSPISSYLLPSPPPSSPLPFPHLSSSSLIPSPALPSPPLPSSLPSIPLFSLHSPLSHFLSPFSPYHVCLHKSRRMELHALLSLAPPSSFFFLPLVTIIYNFFCASVRALDLIYN